MGHAGSSGWLWRSRRAQKWSPNLVALIYWCLLNSFGYQFWINLVTQSNMVLVLNRFDVFFLVFSTNHLGPTSCAGTLKVSPAQCYRGSMAGECLGHSAPPPFAVALLYGICQQLKEKVLWAKTKQTHGASKGTRLLSLINDQQMEPPAPSSSNRCLVAKRLAELPASQVLVSHNLGLSLPLQAIYVYASTNTSH